MYSRLLLRLSVQYRFGTLLVLTFKHLQSIASYYLSAFIFNYIPAYDLHSSISTTFATCLLKWFCFFTLKSLWDPLQKTSFQLLFKAVLRIHLSLQVLAILAHFYSIANKLNYMHIK